MTLSPWRRFPAWVAGIVVVAAMVSQSVLAAPRAAAVCTLTAEDEQYIDLLAQKNMIHGSEVNDCDMAAEGQWFADQVRNSPDPFGTAKTLVQQVINTTPMAPDRAEWEVEAAIFVYAPELIPTIKDQFARQHPS